MERERRRYNLHNNFPMFRPSSNYTYNVGFPLVFGLTLWKGSGRAAFAEDVNKHGSIKGGIFQLHISVILVSQMKWLKYNYKRNVLYFCGKEPFLNLNFEKKFSKSIFRKGTIFFMQNEKVIGIFFIFLICLLGHSTPQKKRRKNPKTPHICFPKSLLLEQIVKTQFSIQNLPFFSWKTILCYKEHKT